MAFGVANGQSSLRPELPAIETEKLGFLSLSGESKIKLLSSAWPSDAPPAPTASLLSIASNKGLLAAAGPDQLVVASTAAVRKGFLESVPEENNIKSFAPQFATSNPRLSQVAFSADENFLIVSAECGGGLAVYKVEDILHGKTQSSFQLGTNGAALRAMVPNPAPENSELLLVVLEGGQLMLANLKTQQFVNGPNGPILKEGVSCVSWSVKGKQLVAGLGNATVCQMTPDGTQKAEIPTPPDQKGPQYISSISWLANDDFLITSMSYQYPSGEMPDTTFYIVNRNKGTSYYSFSKLTQPCIPTMHNRLPPHPFVSRLRDFPPSLVDLLIIGLSASSDISLVSRCSVPLTNNFPAERITNCYTTTSIENDSRRAQLPETKDMMETYPIGMTLDLSSKDKVIGPIKGDNEFRESSTPLPALMALNNCGVLSAWWVIYEDSIRNGTSFPGLTSVGKTEQPSTPLFSGFSAANSTTTSPFEKPTSTGFGQARFGQPSQTGTPRAWDSQASPLRTPQTGKITFGQMTSLGAKASGPVFGSSTGIGSRPSPWGTGTLNQQVTAKPESSFNGGFSAFANQNVTSSTSPFLNLAGKETGTSSFDSSSGFNKPSQSQFTSTPSTMTPTSTKSMGSIQTQSFGSTVAIDSIAGGSTIGGTSVFGLKIETPATSFFGQSSTPSQSHESDMEILDAHPTGKASPEIEKPVSKPPGLGLGGDGFRLGSTFEASKAAAPRNLPQYSVEASAPMFGSNFQSALLGEVGLDPVTPKKPLEIDELRQKTISTTPNSPPKSGPNAKAQLSSRLSEQQIDKGALPSAGPVPTSLSETSIASDALPSSPKILMTSEISREDEASPLAGSPPIKVDATPILPKTCHKTLLTGEKEICEEVGKKVQLTSTSKAPKVTDTNTPDKSFDSKSSQPEPEERGRTVSPNLSVAMPRPVQAQLETPFGDSKASNVGDTSGKSIFQSPLPPSGLVRSTSVPTRRPILHPASRGSQRPPISLDPQCPPQNPPQQSPQKSPKHPQRSQSRVSTPVDLLDDEDELIRKELQDKIQPTRRLAPFLAHQDYVGKINKCGIAGECERVFRDVNSMVDTLGLNERAMMAWIEANRTVSGEVKRSKEDLEEIVMLLERGTVSDEDMDDVTWLMAELDDLKILIESQETSLEECKVRDVQTKLTDLAAESVILVRLAGRMREIRRCIAERNEPGNMEKWERGPLSAEQGAARRAMRDGVACFKALLADAEDSVVVLRTKMASISGIGASKKAPTAEAVQNTILKMTAMIERKNADLDILEMEMRKLDLGPKTQDSADFLLEDNEDINGDHCRAASTRYLGFRQGRTSDSQRFFTPPMAGRSAGRQGPFASPNTAAAACSSPSPTFFAAAATTTTTSLPRMMTNSVPKGATYGLFYTPDASPTGSVGGLDSRLGNLQLGAAASSSGGHGGRKGGGKEEEDLEGLAVQRKLKNLQRQKLVLNLLSERIAKRGVRESRVVF